MSKETLKQLARQSSMTPLESPMAIESRNGDIRIGMPKELSNLENRVPLTPEAICILVKNGMLVSVESGAGLRANYSDNMFSEAGASIVYDHKDIFENDIIIKIEPPQGEELEFLKHSSTLISTLNHPSVTEKYFLALNKKNITAIAYEFIEDKSGEFPIIRAMSEIAGSSIILVAAEYLSSSNNGLGIIFGGITGVPPTKVVVLGAGTVAEFAVRAALGAGASISVFDSHLYRLKRLQYSVGNRISTSIIDSYNLTKALIEADVVIGALRGEKGIAPMVVTEEMVAKMKPNSIIIDVSIDQGGCVETSQVTSHRSPVFVLHDVTHYCVPNIASRFPHTASIALSNIFTPFLIKMNGLGGISQMMYYNKWFMKGVIAHKGTLTNLHLAQKYNLKYKDLGLILSAGF